MRIPFFAIFLILVFGGSSMFSLAYAAIFEVGGNFSYSKQVFGEEKQNSIVSRQYSAVLAMYFFQNTGLELNYSQNEDIITENDRRRVISDIYIVSTQNRVTSNTYGVGIRQALLPPNSFLIPVLSLGYAKVFKKSASDYTLEQDEQQTLINFEGDKMRADSAFASFTLKLMVTRSLSLTGTVKSVFRAFEFNEAKDHLEYGAGLSWVF